MLNLSELSSLLVKTELDEPLMREKPVRRVRRLVGHVTAICSLVIASACASNDLMDPGPAKRVEIFIAQDKYFAGDRVLFTVKNISSLKLTYPYQFCKMELQEQQASGWVTVLVPDGCPLAIAFLDGGTSVSQEYHLPFDLPQNTYRISMPMPVPEGATAPIVRLTTPPFLVAPNVLLR